MPRGAKSHGAGRRARRWFAQHLRRWADALDPLAGPVLPAVSEDDDGPRVPGPPAHWLAHIARAGGDPVWLGSAALLPRPARPVSPQAAPRPRRAPALRGPHGPLGLKPGRSRAHQRRSTPAHDSPVAEVSTTEADTERDALPVVDPVAEAVDDCLRVRVHGLRQEAGHSSHRLAEPSRTASAVRDLRRPTVAPAVTSEIWRQVDAIGRPTFAPVPAGYRTPSMDLAPRAMPPALPAAHAPQESTTSRQEEARLTTRVQPHYERPPQDLRRFVAPAVVGEPSVTTRGAESFDPWPELPSPSLSPGRTGRWGQPPSPDPQVRSVSPDPVSSGRWPELPPPPDLFGDAVWDAARPDPGPGQFVHLDGIRGE